MTIQSLNEISAVYNQQSNETIVVHLCDFCNLTCNFCHWEPKQRYMSKNDFQRVVLDDYKILVLCGQGEPLLHPKITEILNAVPKEDSINLVTNGTIYPDKDDMWLNKINNVRVSLDAASRDVYRKLKGSDHYFKVIKHIERFIENKIHIGLSYVITQENIEDVIPSLLKGYELSRKALKSFYLQFNSLRYFKNNADRYIIEDIMSKISELKEEDKGFKYFIENQTNSDVLNKKIKTDICSDFPNAKKCYLSLISLQVLSNCDVYPCSAAIKNKSHKLGNLRETNWRKIYERRWKLFKELIPYQCSGCKGCWDEHTNKRISHIYQQTKMIPKPQLGSINALHKFSRHRNALF